MEIEKFPTLDEVKKAIQKLEKKNIPEYDGSITVDKYVSKIHDLISKEFGYTLWPLQKMKHKSFSLDIFRARELDSFKNIDLIREHSYPPLNVVGMGRCNFPEYPVFYSSNDGMTALIEAVNATKKHNVKFCISKWGINSPESELVFQNFLQIDLPKENHFNALNNQMKKYINTPFIKSFGKKLTMEQEKGLLEYLKFFHSIFIKDKTYSLSAAIAYKSIFADHNFRTDILMYPSVQTYFKGVNLAINPNFVENHLELKRLYVITLENYNPKNGNVQVTISNYAEVDKNMIFWKKITPDNENYELSIKEDFGHLMNSTFKMTYKNN